MIYVLMISIIVTSGYIGKNIAQKYNNRVKLYSNLIKFANFLLLNINGFNDNISSIIEKFDDDGKFLNLSKLLLFGKSTDEILAQSSLIMPYKNLTEKERKCVAEFYSKLGKYNTESQLHYISSYKSLFENEFKEAVAAQKQKGNISFKISISIGVLICIFII